MPVTDRRNRLIEERVHDPYQLRRKLQEPVRCPRCGVGYAHGRWVWPENAPRGDEASEICPACRRIADASPGGEVVLSGSYVPAHRDEILNRCRNQDQAERATHPLNRIMAIEEGDDGLAITTTDPRLARRIGLALRRSFGGELSYAYVPGRYFLRVSWRR